MCGSATTKTKHVILDFDKVEYYETPTEKINTIKKVRKMWKEIEEQNTSDIGFNILCKNDECCIVNFILKDTI